MTALMQKRINALQKMLKSDNVSGALYATSSSMQYLLADTSYRWQRTMFTNGLPGYEVHGGHMLNMPDCILYVPTEGEPMLFVTYLRADAMKNVDIKQIKCYFELLPMVMSNFIKGIKIACGECCNEALCAFVNDMDSSMLPVPGEIYTELLRIKKDETEIEALRKAAEFTDDAMAKTIPILRPGITSRQVENHLVNIALDAGLRDISFRPACLCIKDGDPTANKIADCYSNKPLEYGCSISFDFGFVINGYCSDFGRSFHLGKAATELSDGYKALIEGQLYAMSKIKPGAPISPLYELIKEKMTEMGYGDYLRKQIHGLCGHQIGIDCHERPWLRNTVEQVFEPGMVMCLEPKLWWPGRCYLRVEDMVLVTEAGCESLTKFDRNLFELI